jgi:hypothetical protein
MFCVRSQVLLDDPPDVPVRSVMEFHLVYAGDLLKSAGNNNKRTWEKHAIRRELHEQIKRLWETHPALKVYAAKTVELDDMGNRVSPPQAFLKRLAHGYSRAGVGFIPLMTEPNGLVCKLDILLLRPEGPGQILDSAGDIDNRIKTLIDALRIPSDFSEMPKRMGDEPDPNPMFCLMEDDKLVTSIKVETDRLLFTRGGSEHEAVVIIRVSTAQIDPFGSPWELHL